MEMNEGWNWLYNTPKWHYFDNEGYSLCRKWFLLCTPPDLKKDTNEYKDRCKMCLKKLKKNLEI